MSRDAIIERLRRLGATETEIDVAASADMLDALTIECLIFPDRNRTFDEVARDAGVDIDSAMRLWRAWGFAPPAYDDRRFGDVDVEMVRFASSIEQVVGEGPAFHTARVMGLAVSRIAESEVAMLRGIIEAPQRAAGASDDDVLATYEAMIGDMIDVADTTLRTLHRHYVVEVVRRQIASAVVPTQHNVLDMVIGFADLTGSTRLAADLALDELDRALSVFEERTSDVIAMAGASLVKRIGDAVMFATPDVFIAALVATTLVSAFSDDPVVPPVRVGLAAGEVVARRGDFYGLPVALAARLETAAEPSTVLVDPQVQRRLAADERWTFAPQGGLTLAGFAEPVDVFELRFSA